MRTHPLGIDHWREAVAGDSAAAVAIALQLRGIDLRDTPRHDLVMSALLAHAINGSSEARRVLIMTLQHRAYVDRDAASIARSWESACPPRLTRSSRLAILEALS